MSLSENSKFELTVGRLIFIIVTVVGIAFTVGMTYQSILPDRQLQKQQTDEIADIKLTLAKVSTILENMQEQQIETKKDVAALQSRQHIMNAEVQIISSYIKEESHKKR